MSGTILPRAHPDWPALDARGEAAERLAAVVAEVRRWETSVPVDIEAFKLDENTREYAEGEHAAIIGPMPPRGPATGLVIHRGRIAAQWGEPGRADIAFSVTKSALSTLAGLALAEGRIPALDGTVRDSVSAAEFASPPNDAITWRHLLTLTSEWRGALWGIPDSIDWNRAVPKRPDSPPKGTPRQTFAPGGFWEFNDVRVNVLALALTHAFGESLEDVLRRRIMEPIGVSPDWRWHGYTGAEITLGGRRIPVVSGGAHWGGGLVIPSFDLARLALLYARRGRWGDAAVLPPLWFDAIRAPTALNPNFGLMWWVNSGGTISALSRSAIWGSGIANFLVADPERDLVIVLRWYDVPRRDELLARIVGALGP